MSPLAHVLHPSAHEAIAALEAVGARHVPALDLTADVPGTGRVQRFYGIVGNPLGPDPADPAVFAPFRAILAQPENAAVSARLRSGALGFCPVNKRLAAALQPTLLARRLHLPWAWRPMNMDFVAHIARHHAATPLPFAAFYSEGVPAVARPGVLFSMPVSGQTGRTILEPDSDDELDPKLGFVLEADASAA
jgi:hypothetical protein